MIFALCILVETFITYIYMKKRAIYFCKPQLLRWLADLPGLIVSEMPRLSVQRLFVPPCALLSGESGPCCIYGCWGRRCRFWNRCIECFYSLSVFL